LSTSTETLPPTALPLYTVADSAEALGVSLSFLYQQIRDGRLATVDLGSEDRPKLRIRADHLQSYIQERTTAARGAA
jgi:excisionase family DNA binding protein